MHSHERLLPERIGILPCFFLNCSCFFLSQFEKEKRQNADLAAKITFVCGKQYVTLLTISDLVSHQSAATEASSSIYVAGNLVDTLWRFGEKPQVFVSSLKIGKLAYLLRIAPKYVTIRLVQAISPRDCHRIT